MGLAWTRDQLEEINRSGKKFARLKLHGADFSGMDLEKADFRSAACPYANFSNTNCQFANFEGANISLTKWDGANLHRANLKEAVLCDADMRGVKDFFGVTLTMECRTWQGLKVDEGFWFGLLYYGLLMEPPTEELKDRLMIFFGADRFKVLRELYSFRQM